MADVLARGVSPAERARGTLLIFLSLAGVAAGLTMVFMGMRSVMSIGGACASGNTAYVPTRPCPEGVALLMFGGIWGGLICLGIYVWQAVKNKVPNLVGLAWPALFLSLGWNFLDYALNPPWGEGIVWGWMVCAIVFGLMGGLPLLAVVPLMAKSFRGTEAHDVVGVNSPLTALKATAQRMPARDQIKPYARDFNKEDLIADLERLDKLHKSGGLTDQEFQDAKNQLLNGRS